MQILFWIPGHRVRPSRVPPPHLIKPAKKKVYTIYHRGLINLAKKIVKLIKNCKILI